MGRVARLSEIGADCDPPHPVSVCVCVCVCVCVWFSQSLFGRLLTFWTSPPQSGRQAFLTEEDTLIHPARCILTSAAVSGQNTLVFDVLYNLNIEFGKKVGAEYSSSSVLSLKGK